ncbi:MAG: DUF2723 domain-containing protein [Ignavibacteria bacterium]|nr:DUF2723 domain-containing protein [Ignavibacteria bacterium]
MATLSSIYKQSPLPEAGLVSAIAFVVYLTTCAPGLMYTDAGELAAVAHTFGVAHPTGYPLFTLITHCWTLLWNGVYGLNVLAALWVATSIGTVYMGQRELLQWLHDEKDASLPTRISSVAAALLLGFSTIVWSQATSIEVYSLQLLLTALAVWSVIKSIVDSERDLQWTILSGLLFGCMAANHLSSVFLLPGLGLLWLSPSLSRRTSILHWLIVPAIAGVALYVVLPLRSAQNPELNWGMVHRNWDAFLYHVKGTQFGVWMFSDKAAVRANWSIFRSLLTNHMLQIGFIPLIWGLWTLLRSQRMLFACLLIMIVGNLSISLGYAIPDIEPYFLPTAHVATIFVAVGLRSLANRIPAQATAILLALPLTAGTLHFQHNDKSDHNAVTGYTTWVLANAEPKAIILTRQWDYFCSAAWYEQQVNGIRKDVTIIDKELLRRTWYAPYLLQLYPQTIGRAQGAISAYMPLLQEFESDADAFVASGKSSVIQERFVSMLNEIIERNADRPIYITPELLNEESGFAVGWERIPAGPLVRLFKPGKRPVQRDVVHGISDALGTLRSPRERLDSALRETMLIGVATMAMYNLDGKLDTTGFRRYRDIARNLHPTSPITGQLEQTLGTRD